MNVRIESSWKALLEDEFDKPYFRQIVEHIRTERAQGQVIYPPGSLIFQAFDHTPADKLKVVLLGQDPYHGPGQAMGLCFSVPAGIPPPPSLMNIFRELQKDTGMPSPRHGDLTGWAKQGVLLLNATLTVRAAEPLSHSRIGWQQFTDHVIRTVSEIKKNLVFMLWGKFAHQKAELIDTAKHLVLKAPHPSPYSASTGFFGCRHFSRTNQYLVSRGIDPIDWAL